MIGGQPVVLDVCCGQGGASRGYADAGMLPVGVDLARRRTRGGWRPDKAIPARYPYQLVIADALEFLAAAHLAAVDLIHASFPCQRFSSGTPDRSLHPDLLTPGRRLLEATGKPWVIENVPGAPMRPDVVLCGCMFGTPDLTRTRWFETSWAAFDLRPPCHHPDGSVTVLTHGARRDLPRAAPVNGQRGKHQCAHVPAAEARALMGIDWMTDHGLGEAIPPAYTRHMAGLFLRDMAGEPTGSKLDGVAQLERHRP